METNDEKIQQYLVELLEQSGEIAKASEIKRGGNR